MTIDPRKPDAVLVPPAQFQVGEARAMKLHAELSRAAGGPLLFGLDGHIKWKFGTVKPDPSRARLFAHGHPMALQPRYEWWIADRAADGSWSALMPALGLADEAGEVHFGYLLPDPVADDPAVQAAIAGEFERRKAQARDSLMARVTTTPEPEPDAP